jgi:hypothetical protein
VLVLCARPAAATSDSPANPKTNPQRKLALIAPIFVLGRRHPAARAPCPPPQSLSSTGWMNGSGTPPDQRPSARRRAPARCPRPRRSGPCFPP